MYCTEGTYNRTDMGTHSRAHCGTVNCTYRGHKQPIRWANWGIVYYTYRGHWQTSQVGRRLGTEGTYNQSDRRHTAGHTGAVMQLYIQRAQITSQSGGTQWDTLGQSTVHSEGTDNQSDRGHTACHTGTVNCIFKGHRQGHMIQPLHPIVTKKRRSTTTV